MWENCIQTKKKIIFKTEELISLFTWHILSKAGSSIIKGVTETDRGWG
jgi:hypothetical protein